MLRLRWEQVKPEGKKNSPQACHLNQQKTMSHSAKRSDSCSDILSVVASCPCVAGSRFQPSHHWQTCIEHCKNNCWKLRTVNCKHRRHCKNTANSWTFSLPVWNHVAHIFYHPSDYILQANRKQTLKKRWSAVRNAEQIGFLQRKNEWKQMLKTKASSFCNWRQAICSAATKMVFKKHLGKFIVS